MVPLAVIGAFLLISSLLIVGYIDTRAEPDTDVDATLALDRTEATMQTVIRDSTQRAAEMAAAEPLTSTADSPWGNILTRSSGAFSGNPFENYLRGLIYMEVKQDLGIAGQEERQVTTHVTLPAVNNPDEFGAAIRRVNITDNGTELTVRLSNVTITATYAGEVIEQRELTIEVTVLTPVLELHKKVSTYQHAIDKAAVTEQGFKQRFNARTYAIGWARGWAQNYQAPIAEVLANRHIEPSANSALYRTQQDVFGAADPDLKNAVRLGWACMALKDGKATADVYTGEQNNTNSAAFPFERARNKTSRSQTIDTPSGIGNLCDGAQSLLAQTTDNKPQTPTVTDLFDGPNRLQETKTIEVGESAFLPLTEMRNSTANASFEKAIQRIFTIEGSVDANIDISGYLDFDIDCTRAYRGGPVSREGSHYVTTTNREELKHDDNQYYEYDSQVTVAVTAQRTCHKRGANETIQKRDTDSYSLDISTTVGEQSVSPTAKIDEVNPSSQIDSEHKYDPGPSKWGKFNNYDGAKDEVTRAFFGGINTGAHEQWLSSMLERANYAEYPPSDRVFEKTKTVELDPDKFLSEFKLTAKLTDDIVDLQAIAANISAEYERREIVTGNPTSQLLDAVAVELKDRYIDKQGKPYENVGEKVIYETRYQYYLTLVNHLNDLAAAHETATSELDNRIAKIDNSLRNATRFLTQGIQQQETDPDAFATSELTDSISYEVSGAPTYLRAGQTVDTERVPAVDQGTTFAPMAIKNENAVEMPYDKVIDGILTKAIAAIFGRTSTPDAEVTFRMAGDVLAAGELAVDAHKQAEHVNRQDTYLSDLETFEHDIKAFETNVNEALDAFSREVATHTVTRLYPSAPVECLLSSSVTVDRPSEKRTCHNHSAEHNGLESIVTDARVAVEDAVNNSLNPYDTETAALLVGSGNATEYIVDNVTRQLADGEYYEYNAFEERYNSSQWTPLVGAAVRSSVIHASGRSVKIGSAKQAKKIDERIQAALGTATTDLVKERVSRAGEAIGTAVGERWLGNTDRTVNRAARVPAGLPLLPIPGQWVATTNAWVIDVAGEYARFEVSATIGTPADGPQLTYVRENHTVSYEIGGVERTLGSVDAITFDSQSVLVVITPPGVGVGDRDSENPECSPTYPSVGAIDPAYSANCTEDTKGG